MDESYGRHTMEDRTESAILEKMLEPVARCFTPAVAQQIAALRADLSTQTRIDELALKCPAAQQHAALPDAELLHRLAGCISFPNVVLRTAYHALCHGHAAESDRRLAANMEQVGAACLTGRTLL